LADTINPWRRNAIAFDRERVVDVALIDALDKFQIRCRTGGKAGRRLKNIDNRLSLRLPYRLGNRALSRHVVSRILPNYGPKIARPAAPIARCSAGGPAPNSTRDSNPNWMNVGGHSSSSQNDPIERHRSLSRVMARLAVGRGRWEAPTRRPPTRRLSVRRRHVDQGLT
jgi:hypothetical protein